MNQINQVKYGAVLSYIAITFSVVAGFLYTPFLVKKLGMSDYALYTLSASVIAYFTIDFGIGSAITRYIAKYRAENNIEKVNDLLGLTLKLYLVIDLIIVLALLIVYFFSDQIFIKLTPNELDRFKKIFLISTFFVTLTFPFLPINGVFIGYEKMFILKLIDLLTKIFSISALVISLYLGYGLYGVVFISSLIVLIERVFKFIYLYKGLKIRINVGYKDKILLKSIGSFSFWTTIAMIGDRFFFMIIPVLLATFSNSKAIAIFAIAASIEGYILTFAGALNGLFLPRVMKMVVEERTSNEFTTLMIKVGRIQLFIVGFLIVGMISLGQEFIYHWLGSDYEKSYYAMVLVLLPCLIHMTQGIANELIFAKNKIKYRALVYVLGSIISVVSIVLLAPSMGAIGAAIGVFLAFVIAHELVMNIVYEKVLKLDIVRFFKECHVKMILPLILTAIVGFLLQYTLVTESLVSFVGKGVLWMIIYLLVMWFGALNTDEKTMLTKPILNLLFKLNFYKK